MNDIENFFDSLASTWDQGETHTEKERRELLDAIGIKKGDKILDIACGTGVITSLLYECSQSDVDAIDISEKMISLAKEKYKDKPWAHFEKGDFLSLDKKEEYDVCVIYNAYPHFLSPEDLCKKLYSVLKPNGRFAILHSMSREALSLHHSGKAAFVSRTLADPQKESQIFASCFTILKAEEDEYHYLIVGEKHK